LACPNDAQAKMVQEHLSIWNINSYGEFFLQIVEKYENEYKSACGKIAAERERFIKELRKFEFLEVYPSEANYVLCEVKKPYTAKSLALELWTRANCLIKDCSSKKGFGGKQFIRLAVKSAADDDALLSALQTV
jgi:histidinol-phosphate/aromatic aminotransferase/cobyric acid decarboxylase-like protein